MKEDFYTERDFNDFLRELFVASPSGARAIWTTVSGLSKLTGWTPEESERYMAEHGERLGDCGLYYVTIPLIMDRGER